MARIRSIHPHTPIDPEFAAVPVEARLMFIYSWTAADDAGNLEGNPLGLKAALFPIDEWATIPRITGLLEILIAGRFYDPYEVDGKRYLHIRTFNRYQKPDHPTKRRCPLSPGQEYEYQVRQGTGWITKTEKGALPEPTPNVPRMFPELTPNVLAGVDLDLDLELDLERKGRARRKSNPRAILPREAATSEAPSPIGSGATDSPPKPNLEPSLVPTSAVG